MSRFESLSSILSRPPTPSALVTAPAASIDDGRDTDAITTTAIDPSAVPATPVPRRRLPAVTGSSMDSQAADPRPPKSAESSGGVRRIAFRVDPNLHAALGARAAATRSSHGQVVLDAVEDAHQRQAWPDLLAPTTAGGEGTGLFPRLKTRTYAQPTVPVEIRLDARAAAILDQLAEQVGARTRTDLITAALRAHLDP